MSRDPRRRAPAPILDGDDRLERRGLVKTGGKGELETYYPTERKAAGAPPLA